MVTETKRVTRQRPRLLLIDDDAIVVNVMRRALGDEYEMTTVLDPREAIMRIRTGERYDTILCDLMMPQVTGMDVHAELTKHAPDQASRMVFLTGGAFTERSAAFLEAIPNRRLEKPFDLRELRAIISEVSQIQASAAP